uniref:NADH dehydrogenase subunit 4L n=1 Tax=Lithoredo abatanica TaxID=2586797 RepID=UPI0020285BE7|nr:NADH dehydrogenase subunit 4L [Lithoredo abatanica]UPX89233.1 NADH dehydrogenase subunit 4L [Lithoredo abatanica]UPX89245.1 NADH dehydrogenase subunit 4L [Lithoredo abatanica]
MDILCWVLMLNWGGMVMFKRFVDFLSLLIFLEMLVITLFTFMVVVLGLVGNWFMCYVLVAFLTFFVCEAVVGLSLLVSAARNMEYYSTASYCSLKF